MKTLTILLVYSNSRHILKKMTMTRVLTVTMTTAVTMITVVCVPPSVTRVVAVVVGGVRP